MYDTTIGNDVWFNIYTIPHVPKQHVYSLVYWANVTYLH